MKLLLLLSLLLTQPLHGEERAMSKKKEAVLVRFNKQFDSIFTMKIFHGADSLKAVARMNQSIKLLK